MSRKRSRTIGPSSVSSITTPDSPSLVALRCLRLVVFSVAVAVGRYMLPANRIVAASCPSLTSTSFQSRFSPASAGARATVPPTARAAFSAYTFPVFLPSPSLSLSAAMIISASG
nr:hypothetical protein [Escherichia coli]